MRRTLILALTALVLSAAICWAGAGAVSRAVSAAEAYRQEAEDAVRRGDAQGAAARLRSLSGEWRRRGRILELVTAHDALSDVGAAIADARVCLENGDAAEFYRASAALRAALERMRETEAVRVMNLF